MENTAALIEQIMGDKQAVILLITVGSGFIIGRMFRFITKMLLFFFIVLFFFVLGLQYAGFINITINYESISLFTQIAYSKLSEIGLSEHAFFWVPFVYSIRKSRIPSVS
ncbi:MAG: hypothetical protein DWQ05_18280 [Calditrichaeota bacterium]|nr:MAG: hypothetical protein DWQ05_18280 [Calditrichota bacterium]